jgi:hypothetical protein
MCCAVTKVIRFLMFAAGRSTTGFVTRTLGIPGNPRASHERVPVLFLFFSLVSQPPLASPQKSKLLTSKVLAMACGFIDLMAISN